MTMTGAETAGEKILHKSFLGNREGKGSGLPGKRGGKAEKRTKTQGKYKENDDAPG